MAAIPRVPAFAQRYRYGIVWGIQNPTTDGNAGSVDPNQAIVDATTDAERAGSRVRSGILVRPGGFA